VQFEPALEPAGKHVREAEGWRVHPDTVELPEAANKRGTDKLALEPTSAAGVLAGL
jgi:hypothetical protein